MSETPPDLARLTDPRRLAALQRTDLLDAPPNAEFDRITRMAAEQLGVPVVLVSLLDAERQFFVSGVGLDVLELDARETPLSHSVCQYVVAGQGPVLVPDAREVPWLRDNLAVSELGVIAYAGFPLYAADGHSIGSFCAIDRRSREWSDRDADLIRDYAALVQAELDLLAARQRAHDVTERLRRLLELSDAARPGRDVRALLDELASACAGTFAADFAVIELLDAHDGLIRRAGNGLGGDWSGYAPLLGAGFARRAGFDEQAVMIPDLVDAGEPNALTAAGIRCLLVAPLIVDERSRGTIYVGTRAPSAYSELDRQLLAVTAERFAGVIARTQLFERDQEVARTLVAALQPERLPSIPGLRLAARYQPAERGLGGDWYDVFALPGGVVGLAIGDVVGHGIEAAAGAVRLRHALRGAVLSGYAPTETVSALNAYAAQEEGARASTLFYLELEPATRRLRWACAGHLPAVVAAAGRGEWLGLADGPPLGVVPARDWRGGERTLAPGARLVLYTDGLVERRGEPVDDGMGRIAAATVTAPDLEALCDAALRQAPAPRRDDVALVAVELE